MVLPVTLYTVSGVLVFDSANGQKLLGKYYECDRELSTISARKLEAFERNVYDKTRSSRGNNQIALVDAYAVLHKACGEVTVCVVGRSEDCNELLLYGVVEAITDALNEVFKNSVDKKVVLDRYDMLALIIDDIIDRGVIIESDGFAVAKRLSAANSDSPSAANESITREQPSLSSAFNFAKQHLARTLLKQ